MNSDVAEINKNILIQPDNPSICCKALKSRIVMKNLAKNMQKTFKVSQIKKYY